MCYFIIEGDIDMVISEWPDEWRIPTITRGSTGNNNRRRGRIGENTASENPSAQEATNGPRQAASRK
jgi:hypothetical protein